MEVEFAGLRQGLAITLRVMMSQAATTQTAARVQGVAGVLTAQHECLAHGLAEPTAALLAAVQQGCAPLPAPHDSLPIHHRSILPCLPVTPSSVRRLGTR